MFVTLEQRVATREAWQSWRGLVRALGEPAPGPLPGLFAPPSPERIAHTPYEVFHRFGIERRRADVVRRLAVVARRLEETVSLPLEAAYRRFAAVTGVGPWTAARIGLIALGDPDAVAVGDLHVPHMVTWALASERRGSDERMLELLEPFRGHRARVIRLLLLAGPR
jgi:3-methyladenine DNA glycosylase/8-oxoguanine DNA glycosylase